VDDYEDQYNELMNEEWFGDAVDDLCNPMTDSSPSNVNVGFASHINVDTVDNQINVGSSKTVFIDSNFKSFAIDYFKAGKMLFLISHQIILDISDFILFLDI